MKGFFITAYPYAIQNGYIEVPDSEADDPYNYINEHFRDIDFEEPELDYRGTDFEIEPAEEEDLK